MPHMVRLGPHRWPRTRERADAAQHAWRRQIIGALRRRGVREVSYGRAAKIVAIYLKAAVVLGPYGNEPFAKYVHPPIDAILKKSLRVYCAGDASLSEALRSTPSWTRLTQREYEQLIVALRTAALDEREFWTLERYWEPTLT